jgi:hypothetical protein
MDTKMQVAIVGLVGVLVGSVISVLGQFVLTLWSARRDDKTKGLLVKLAARLVADELNTANAAIIQSHVDNKWYFDPDLCNTVDWKMYRSTIAPVLPYGDWLSLCNGTLAVKIIRDARSDTYDPENPSLTTQTRDVIETAGPKVEEALSTIQPYAADALPSRARRLRSWLVARMRRSKRIS